MTFSDILKKLMPSKNITSLNELKGLGNGLVILNFWADWAPPCAQLNTLFDQLADKYSDITFVKVEAEKAEDVTQEFDVAAVPTFVFLKNQKVIDKVEGANGPDLASNLSFLFNFNIF